VETEQAKFEGWAIVEMMGHQREIGYVTTEAYGVAVLFRVDVPELAPCEYVLKRPEYGQVNGAAEKYMPAGTKVQREGRSARSRLVSPAAVYAINPCTEEAAREMLLAQTYRKLICLELPQKQLELAAQPETPSHWVFAGNQQSQDTERIATQGLKKANRFSKTGAGPESP
jgi:hypothetical protein